MSGKRSSIHGTVSQVPHFVSSSLSSVSAVTLNQSWEGEACQGILSGIQGRNEIKASSFEYIKKSLWTDKATLSFHIED